MEIMKESMEKIVKSQRKEMEKNPEKKKFQLIQKKNNFTLNLTFQLNQKVKELSM